MDFDTLWSGRYAATALNSPESQRAAFEYILSHGVKEGLVETPEQWPGVHCARALFSGRPDTGRWLNATDYGCAKRRQDRKPEAKRKPVDKAPYFEHYEIRLDRLPALEDLSEEQYRAYLKTLRQTIIDAGRSKRKGAPLGVEGVLALPRTTRFPLPRAPWFEGRKRMIVWGDPTGPEPRAYLARYWRFQLEFREASERYRSGEMDVVFPSGAYRPTVAPYRSARRMAALA